MPHRRSRADGNARAVANDRFLEALAAGSCQRSARTACAVQPDRNGAVDGLSASRSARNPDQSGHFRNLRGQGPRHRGGWRRRVGVDVRVRALFATHARDEDEHQPHLPAPQCRSHRRVEHMGRAAAHAGACRRRVLDCDSASHLFNGCRRESRQDADGGACGSVVRSHRRLACPSARRADCRRFLGRC